MAEHGEELRQGAKAAAAAAAVGAAVGMARAIASRAEDASHGDDHPDDDERAEEREASPQPQQAEQQPQQDDDEQEEQPREDTDGSEPLRGAGFGRLRRLTEQARGVLQELSGADVESVSGVERTRDGWRVTLEAVEVRRIPDSTDVLASYVVELDDDGDVVRYERGRRYSRSQSDQRGEW